MSTARYDAPLIAGKAVYGITDIGTLGSDIPSSGDNGAGFIYADLVLPADAGKKYRGQIVTWPTAGKLAANEDTSFTYDPNGAPDGTYSFVYKEWENGVDIGNATVTLHIGASDGTASAALLTAGVSLITGSASGVVNGTASGALLTATTSLQAGTAQGGSASTANGALLTAGVSLVPGSAAGAGDGSATGALLTAGVSLVPGSASGAGGAVAAGALLTAGVSLLPGAASATASGTASGALLTVHVLLITSNSYIPDPDRLAMVPRMGRISHVRGSP